MLNCSAIAKGFACDRVASLLEKEGCGNFMVEIGGEVVTRGINSAKGREWHPAVRLPDDKTFWNPEYKAILKVKDKAMATSGNYLNYYIEDGQKYAHTINPKTGYPALSNLLSVTVFAPDCMTADAYATVFMVAGLEKSKELYKKTENLEVYFIYDDEGKYKSWMSEGFSKFIFKEYE